MIFQMIQKMLLLWPHSNIDSTETLCYLLMYYNVCSRKGQILQARLGLECSSLNSDQNTENILFLAPPVSVVSLKVLLISSSTAQSIQTKGKHSYQTTSEPIQLKTSYLDVKMLQNKTINHSFCKLKIVLLILEDFPNSAQHNYT